MQESSTKTGFRVAAIGFLVLCALLICYGALRKSFRSSSATPQYIFLFIGDGMGNSQIAAAESYISYKAGKLGGEQLLFTQFPCLGLMTTYSADHQVTCSSASATAFSSGVKTNNNYLGVTPDGALTRPFSLDLKEDGYKIGIISSVPINHATPAAFYAHSTDRWGYYDISLQLPSSGYEFFASPGFVDFYGRDGKQRSTSDFIREKGYTVCWGEEDFLSKKDTARQIILCHESMKDKSVSDYSFDYDRTQVSLSRMLELGLSYIGDKDPFFFMVEGGEIDWFAHENTVFPMVRAIRHMDDAVAVAYEFYKKHPDETLIVVTADHETGGLALGYNYDWAFSVQDWAKLEKEWAAENYRDTMDFATRKAFQRECGFGWTTNEHTGAPVPVYAVGKGAERFRGRIDNADIPELILGKSREK